MQALLTPSEVLLSGFDGSGAASGRSSLRSSPETASKAQTDRTVIGSNPGRRRKRNAWMARVANHEAIHPGARPSPSRSAALFRAQASITSVRCAPRAMRMPTSRVRRLTEYAISP